MHTHACAAESNLTVSGRAALGAAPRRCQAELSNDLLDEEGALLGQLIDFAFDTLGAQALDVRVTTALGSRLMIAVQDTPMSSQL